MTTPTVQKCPACRAILTDRYCTACRWDSTREPERSDVRDAQAARWESEMERDDGRP